MLAVLGKDLAVELRSRYALGAIAVFGLATLVAVSFAVGPQASGAVQAALLWVVLLFGALTGLQRSFVAEEDARTADLLRLAASPAAVYLGKLASNGLLLLALCVLLVPGYGVLMGLAPRDPVLLAGAVLAGCWGLAAVLTLTSALVARARVRGAVGTVVALPLLMPLLFLAIDAAAAAYDGTAGWAAVRGLVGYGGVMTTVSLLLFEAVWYA